MTTTMATTASRGAASQGNGNGHLGGGRGRVGVQVDAAVGRLRRGFCFSEPFPWSARRGFCSSAGGLSCGLWRVCIVHVCVRERSFCVLCVWEQSKQMNDPRLRSITTHGEMTSTSHLAIISPRVSRPDPIKSRT